MGIQQYIPFEVLGEKKHTYIEYDSDVDKQLVDKFLNETVVYGFFWVVLKKLQIVDDLLNSHTSKFVRSMKIILQVRRTIYVYEVHFVKKMLMKYMRPLFY